MYDFVLYLCLTISYKIRIKMKLTQEAIRAIKLNKRLRTRLALDMDKHTATIDRWLDDNAPNGDLTTVKALQIIREELGLLDDQILEEEHTTAA